MSRVVVVLWLCVLFVLPSPTSAQTGQGSLRGYVRDEQGGALPGVTVTASSAEALRPVTAQTNEEGYYRLINLPPGT
ncbi:MAG: carboxypeptidase-like regulatory domain-containing protein, partial [Vicinamibacterales bacterium]